MSIPKNMQEKYNEIEKMITNFCDEKLNEEYKELSLRLCEKLCRKRPSPLLKGKPEAWACAIVYAIGSINFIFDKSQPLHMTSKELAEGFGVSASNAGTRAKQILDMFKMNRFDPEWTLPSKMDDNLMVWMLTVNGYLVDIRMMPLEVQMQAFEQGLIPYIPALKSKEEIGES